jgi:2-dehydropantoate 2-reductase
MKICVFGAGAVGGHLAARLASGGHDVSIVVREATARAIARDGFEVQSGAETIRAKVRAFTSTVEAGVQDVVLVTVKATSLGEAALALPALLGPQTPVVFVVNGIPWWYAHGESACPSLDMLDPGGAMARAIGFERVIGSVVFSSNEVVAPGRIINRSTGLNTLTLGEIDGSLSARVNAISSAVQATRFAAPVTTDIRREVWSKLVSSNVAILPICSLVGQPMTVLGRNPELVALGKAIIGEARAVAASAGHALDIDPEQQFDARRINNPHKPSMLQDLENRRPMEIDAVLVAVQRFARKAGIPTPHLDAVTAILKQQASDAGLYKRASA